MSALPTRRARDLDQRPDEQRWLIDDLWAEQAVGLVGGEPKCCKSFLALDVAVAVASATPCLRRFPVRSAGRVLLFAAEDAPHVVRERLSGIARAAGVAFDSLDVNVITAPSLRLDLARDQENLADTLAEVKPRLLVLDPLVRMHRIDENVAAEITPILDFLRYLQRRFRTAVLLVHHARKGAGRARGGQALRGSSELHAIGDSNLYLRRDGERLRLAIEHRAAPSRDGIALELRGRDDALALEVIDDLASQPRPDAPPSHTERVLEVLAAAPAALPLRQIRRACRMNTARLSDALASLVAAGRVAKSPDGYQLVDS